VKTLVKSIWGVGLIVLLFSFRETGNQSGFEFHQHLSDYHFFEGDIADLQPAPGIVPYDLHTPLFSNYAEKARFIKLPAGEKAIYHDSMIFDMPLGTVLIKNFYYPHDFRKPELGRRIIETRLLVFLEDGWKAYAYIWNEKQTEATYEPAGDITEIEYTDPGGKKIRTSYVIPSQPQCKGCHTVNKSLSPIGIAARHLNGNFTYEGHTQNQLQYWQAHGMIDLPATSIPANAVWNQVTSGTVEQRARAYLDINCGHCHHATGIANTSGLFLSIHETNPTRIGINKTPVAAGRGSGNLKYNIEPGSPHKSILVYRMTTTDPGIAMPEIGREQIHREGVELISQWIREMK
jgi:uncharacterized repeat protein (TIGR03806 family)